MNFEQKIAILERRCRKLESYGFTILHDDSRVKINGGFIIDFSAISEDLFIAYALQKTFEAGRKSGKENLQDNLNTLLGRN